MQSSSMNTTGKSNNAIGDLGQGGMGGLIPREDIKTSHKTIRGIYHVTDRSASSWCIIRLASRDVDMSP